MCVLLFQAKSKGPGLRLRFRSQVLLQADVDGHQYETHDFMNLEEVAERNLKRLNLVKLSLVSDTRTGTSR